MLRDITARASGSVVSTQDDFCSPGRVLVIGDPLVAAGLRDRLPAHFDIRVVASSDESEGFDVDVVVIAGSFPLLELTQLRVHPTLSNVPAIVLMGGRSVDDLNWSALNASVVTDALEDGLPSTIADVVRAGRAIA